MKTIIKAYPKPVSLAIKVKVPHPCMICGSETKHPKFCSQKCMGKSYTKTLHRICPQCGKEFTIVGARTFAGNYCSDECRNNRHLRQAYGYATSLKLPDQIWKYAYLAALIDGEGSIIFGSKSQRIVTVANTDYGLMEWLQSNFGGNIRIGRAEGARRKTQYKWDLSQRLDVKLLLTSVMPFLVIKREKAVKMLLDLSKWASVRMGIEELSPNEEQIETYNKFLRQKADRAVDY